MSLIANMSFSTGTFPPTLKTANVIPIYKWFQSFLEDRKQFTSVQSSKSAEKPIRYGIPQGSVSKTSSFYFV